MTQTKISQNGWAVLLEPPPAVTIPGTDRKIRVRPGDVAVVLAYLAGRFHEDVERIDKPVHEPPGTDDWGWAYRPVRGAVRGFSNHASGTAIDLNATLHPRGRKNTFTGVQKRRVRRILAELVDRQTGRSVVRWGEDYVSSPTDGMHFEINADAAAVHRVAERIRAKQSENAMPIIVQPDPAPSPGETDMFLAHVPGEDKRIFLVTGDGKRLIPNAAVWRELRDTCKIRDVGDVSTAVLNLFPTIPPNATAIVPAPRQPAEE